jgi:ribosomal-protein-alanine N-acetyltransferase
MSFDLIPAAQVHGEALAAMHRICFREPWSAQAFQSSLSLPTTKGLIAQSPQVGPGGMVLWSVVAEQAEILTIAVLPPYRHHGLGRRLLAAAWDDAVVGGCLEMFLDVAEDNVAAQRLYAAFGFRECARRKGYYQPDVDGIMMRKDVVQSSLSSDAT